LDRRAEVREEALEWAPDIALYADRVSERREDVLASSLVYRKRSVELDPENADRLMQLGIRAELAGDYGLAERSLLGAAERSRLYLPRYLLAQYYFRRGDPGRFWPWARAALGTTYGDMAPVLELCWRVRPDPAWLAESVVPARPTAGRQYLAFLMQHEQRDAALKQARTIAASARAEDAEALLDFCDGSLARDSAGDALEIWNTLCRRGLRRDEPLDLVHGPWLTNVEFLHRPTARGFDWRLVENTGVRCAIGGGALHVSFSGRQPERCPIAWQYVPMDPGGRYRLHCDVNAAYPEAARAVTCEQEPGRITLLYQRPAGSPRVEGMVSISHVRLERLQ
jgi:hypothetical protein